jgi:hypothetical protein
VCTVELALFTDNPLVGGSHVRAPPRRLPTRSADEIGGGVSYRVLELDGAANTARLITTQL